MGERLNIQTLGSLSIQEGNQPVEFETRKEAALLVYLAYTRRTYPREVLAELLWEDRPQAQSLANLRHVLAQLRQKVGDYMLIASDTVAMDPDSDWWLDTAAFESQLDRAGTLPQAIESALDLHQGDFLAGFFVDSTAFEQWASHERKRLRLRAMQALDTLVTCHLKEGGYAAGLARATQLMQMDNLREETHQHLMRLLALSGQRGKALEQYETCRQLLYNELDVEPTPATTDLYEQIKAGKLADKASTAAIRSYLPYERIGRGSFGEVFRASQAIGDQRREVAIKVIRPEYANHPDFIRRFETEAQIAGRLEHPHIVPLYDYWREPGGAYLVMRCLPTSLDERLSRGPLTLAEAVRLVEQISAALAVAHRQGVVHRDVKPANILLDEDGNAYLTDFGVAKVLDAAARATQEGALIGSPGYLSPEQIKGDPVTPASDLYSFGLVLFEVLTGRMPFPGDLSPASLLYKQVHEPLPALHNLSPDLPTALDGVLQTATAKDPASRYPDALSLAEAFHRAAGLPRPVLPDTPLSVETPSYRGEDMTWIVAPRNPYKGLHAFEEADAADFFGREALVQQLLARLGEEDDLGRFLAVIGPSGCGKSSVVKAGLLPALREGRLPGAENWFVASMTPREHPLRELGAALASVAARSAGRLLEQLQADPRGLLWAAESVLGTDVDLLLVVDQFEELFAVTQDNAERDQFLALLHTAVTAPDSKVRVILTLRADFTDRPLEYPTFGALLQRQTEFVLPLSPEELEQAVSLPADQVGLILEPGLAAAMVADVSGQPGALPLLQYALTELYHRRDDHMLTLATYHALGGTQGALVRRADELCHDLNANEQEAVRQLFLRLVTPGEEVEDTRRRVYQAEVFALGGAEMQRVMDVFGRARLLTFDHDPATRAPTVEVAHEALIREWGQLRMWLDESRADIRQQRLLAAAAAEWEQAGRHADYLLARSRLAQFEDWAAHTDLALTSDERLFLDASVVEQQARQVRRQRIRNLAFGVAVAAALIMAVLALAAFSQRGQAIDARATSDASARIARQSADEARELALINGAQAALASGDMDTALALAVTANQGENPPPEAQVILSEAAYRPGTIRVLKGHTEPNIESVAFSPDARFALSGANDDMLLLWDIDPTSATFGTVLDRYEHTADVWSVVFRPDGRTAVFGSSDTNVYLIEVDLTSHTFGAILHRFEGHTDGVEEVALSPDGHYALSGSYDSTLILWDVDPASPAVGTALHQFEGHTDEICDVAYSPDGRTGLSAALDDTVIQWDVDPASPTFGAVLQRFEVPLGLGLPAAVFSPDGRLALSGGDTAILWDLETHDIIHRFEAGSFSEDVAFSPDGHTALVAQGDGIITLWNVETGKLITRLSSHTAGVLSAVFSPDGRRILSCGLGDGVLRLWDVQYGTAMRTIVSPLRTDLFLSDVALSPNGRAVLWGGTTYMDEPEPAILTDIATGQEIYRFDGYSNGVSSATFAPDGRTALISGWAGEMILWDMDTGERLRTFTGHMASLVVGSNATYTAFSPDGRTALSVAKEEQAVLWDVAADSPTFGQPIRHFADPEGEILIFSPSFSPDGRTALTGTRSGSVLLWDVEMGQVIYRLTGYTGLPGAGFSPDGRTALTWFSGESNLILWDVGTGQEIRRLSQKMTPCVAPCAAAAFSPDGRTAFSDSVAGVVTQWDIATGQAIRHYLDTGWAVYLSPDGRSFFTTPDAVNLVQWRIDTLDELLAWTLTHRYVRELTCSERETYQIEPLCDAAGNYPASTPYLTATPPATPTVTPTADLKRTTATPTATVTPTVAPLTLSVAHVGENRGDVAIGDTQFWTYEGRAGEVLTIRVEADHPANWHTRREGEPTPEGGWFDTRLSVTSPEGAILMHGYSAISIQYNDIEPGENTNSQVEGLTLPVDGTYLILVSGNLLQTGGAYTLTIESEPPGTVTPTLGR